MDFIKVVVEEDYSVYSVSQLTQLFDDYYAMYGDNIELLDENEDYLAIVRALKEKGLFSE